MADAPQTVKCGAALSDGTVCERDAAVTNALYFYSREPLNGGCSDPTLSEIHYSATCPGCGPRIIIEKQGE